jgi:hypothetical protein
MVQSIEVRDEYQRLMADAMLADADLALTFLDLADSTKIIKDQKRRQREATTAYETITVALPTFVLTTEQRILLNRKLTLLKLRLYAASISK